MRQGFVGLILAGVASAACAGQPVTINNPQNTQTAVVDASGLHVVCDSGCSGGGGTVIANQGTPNAGGANSWYTQGAGTAGSPSGGIVSIQGVSGGTNLPVNAASGAYASGSIVSGADVTEGQQTDSASCLSPRTLSGCLAQLHTDMNSAIPGGTNVIGYVGGDGTSGSPSIHVATTQGTGTAGTPAGGVASIQGVSGMTPVQISSTTPAAGAGSNTILCSLQIKATATACGSSAAHNITGFTLDNTGNSVASQVQIFNLATGSVTLGTTTPAANLSIPPNGTSNLQITPPIGFSTAVTVACTTTAGGSTAPSANCGITFLGN